MTANTATGQGSASVEVDASGVFVRQPNLFRNRMTADGSSGYRAEPGRYHLYVSDACPWASRAIIVRKLKALDEVISMTVLDPIRDERGWAFREGADHSADPINGFEFLRETYLTSDPDYGLRPTVPVVWDRDTGRIVSNDFHTITIDLETQFEAYTNSRLELYPRALRSQIDEINSFVFENVNDGVYKAGFARTQEAYGRAVTLLFDALDTLDRRLSTQRFLLGERLTDADIRLFTTLVRFDAVYHYHFKCNLRRLTDYPNLWGYARDLFQTPGIGVTVNFDHIKRHYYLTHAHLNPSRIVPAGPLVDWTAPHGREGADE
jgi:glutathionyl-hydroquinone reductase